MKKIKPEEQEQQKEQEQKREPGPMPFSKSLCWDALFTYSQLNELHRLVRLTIEQRSMLLCTGQAGVGKTTAIRAVTDGLPTNKYLVVYLGQDQTARASGADCHPLLVCGRAFFVLIRDSQSVST